MRCGVTGKVMFKTEAGALNRGAEILEGEDNRRHSTNRFRAYKCEFCGKYHLTGKALAGAQYTYRPNPKKEIA